MSGDVPGRRILAWIDALARREVALLRARHASSPDELEGRWITDAQIDALLRDRVPAPESECEGDGSRARAALVEELEEPRWSRLRRAFGIDPLGCEVLALALGPELEPRYERVFAYLNDDARQPWLTRDLALRLLAPANAHDRRRSLRDLLADGGPLFAQGLLQPPADAPAPWPRRALWLDAGVAHVLIGLAPRSLPLPTGCVAVSPRRDPRGEARLPDPLQQRIERVGRLLAEACPPWVIAAGRRGSGRTRVAASLADALRVSLVQVAPDALEDADRLAAWLCRQRLTGALALLDAEHLLGVDGRPTPWAQMALSCIARAEGRIVLRTREARDAEVLVAGTHRALPLDLDTGTEDRVLQWSAALAESGLPRDARLRDLAGQFRLSARQIEASARRAQDVARLEEREIGQSDLVTAARDQSRTALGKLATKVTTRARLDDLVLPDETRRELLAIAEALRHRHVLFDEYGFGGPSRLGRGSALLLAGPPGGGKTLAIEALSVELGLDLFRLEISSVVSKYIGQTSSNLERVFDAARDSGSILYFDECDALLGRRAQVKDARDRYANVEVAYLLQRIESHDGILACSTNRLSDADPAFVRRFHHVLEFPPPRSSALRRELLERHLPPGLAISDDVDLPFLAESFELAGGDIRNVVRDAALAAAASSGVLSMQHLVRAMARHLRKRGTAPAPGDFKQHFGLLSRPH